MPKAPTNMSIKYFWNKTRNISFYKNIEKNENQIRNLNYF